MIPTTFMGWRRLREKRAEDRIPDRFEEYCEDLDSKKPIGSFSSTQRNVEFIYTRYPNLQSMRFLKDFEGEIESRIAKSRIRFQTDSIHEPFFRSLVTHNEIDDEWFQRNDDFIRSLSFREKMALVAMTNKSQQHVQRWKVSGHVSREFMDRVRAWRDDVHGYLPIFFPLLDRYPDPDISSLRRQYRRIVKKVCPGLTDTIIQECVIALSQEVTDIFLRAPRTARDMVVHRGLKHRPSAKWTRQGFTATSLNPFHALRYAESCIQQIRILPGTPLLFLGGLSSFRDELECLLPDTTHCYRTEQFYRTVPMSPLIRNRCPDTTDSRRLLIQKVVAVI
jgi:hypothetical protein